MVKRLSMLAVVVLVASSCGGQQSDTGEDAPTAESVTVTLDGKTDAFNAAFTVFFPNQVTVHAGDTVEFELPRFSGEPHTVTFGTIADAAVKKVEALGPTATFAAQESSPELLRLVDVFNHQPPDGPPSPNQSVAQPCFLDSGAPPGDDGSAKPPWKKGGAAACAKREQPTFNGKQTWYNSGLFDEDGERFSIDLSDDIAPGTYNFICAVHRGGMTGKLTVVDDETKVPAAAEVRAQGRRQLAELVTAMQPAVDQLKGATVDKGVAGAAVPTAIGGLAAEFAPKEATLKTGQPLSLNLFFFHTIAVNAPEDAIGIFVKGPDGSPAFNPKVGAPSLAPDPPLVTQVFPPPDNAKPVTINAKWNGEGFFNSGLLGSVPPALITYKLTFTNPGTYQLRCGVHPDMKAQVTVT